MVTNEGYPALESALTALVRKCNERSDTNNVCFELCSPSRGWSWKWSSLDASEQYFIASVTKLYVTTLIMQLRNEGQLDPNAPVSTYLAPSVMEGIHVLHGMDSSNKITIKELLSHTSGIADYFEQRRKNGSTQIGKVLQGDFTWTFNDILRITKEELTPKFSPSAQGKALYSDTNYQLLGAVVEAITGNSYENELRQRILLPLGLEDSYPFTIETIDRYNTVATMLYGTKRISIPMAMASVRADGGLVSTASDGIVFLKAFMSGELFPTKYLDEMRQQWNPIFPPLEYGIGMMRFALPRYYTLFKKVPEMIGHSGVSGAVLFFVPELDLFVSGTVNQIKKRSLSFRLMAQLVMTCQDTWRK